MANTTKNSSANKTLELMRRLVADKRETQRQLREAFAANADLLRTITELDNQHAERNT